MKGVFTYQNMALRVKTKDSCLQDGMLFDSHL